MVRRRVWVTSPTFGLWGRDRHHDPAWAGRTGGLLAIIISGLADPGHLMDPGRLLKIRGSPMALRGFWVWWCWVPSPMPRETAFHRLFRLGWREMRNASHWFGWACPGLLMKQGVASCLSGAPSCEKKRKSTSAGFGLQNTRSSGAHHQLNAPLMMTGVFAAESPATRCQLLRIREHLWRLGSSPILQHFVS